MKTITRTMVVSLCSLLLGVFFVYSATAVTIAPSAPTLTDGPFLITAYSFQGAYLRYIQIYNDTDEIASLDGWKIQTNWGSSIWQMTGLSGYVEPGKRAIAASATVVPDATFSYDMGQPGAVTLEALSLIPPESSFNTHTVTIDIKTSTVRNSTTNPATFVFQRNVSSSTGNYLSTFTALASDPASIESDQLYEPFAESPVQIVEIYPHSRSCSPAEDSSFCHDYVKLFNTSTASVPLDKIRVRSGSVGQASTSSNTAYPFGNLASGAYVIVPTSLTDGGGHVWIEDKYGLVTYVDTSETYPSGSSYEGQAWSYNPARTQWQWTKYPTPDNSALAPRGVRCWC